MQPPTTMRRRRVDQWLHGEVIYPTAIRAVGEGGLFARLTELQSLQWLRPDRLAAQQAQRLAVTLTHAARHCPWYASRGLPHAVSVDEACDVLRSLPFLTKQDLQQHGPDLIARPQPRRVTRKITGGSTGQAVTVVKDRAATAFERAAMWLGYSWRGVEMGDRVARFWGAPFATRRRWLTRAADFAMHRVRFSAFAFDDSALARYWRRCLRFKPDYFHGYVSMLEAFAGFVASRGYDATPLGLKSVIATSEVLTSLQRALIEQAFHAPVQIEYGCGELGPIAYECDRGSLHLLTTDVFVEFLKSDGSAAAIGETGEIVVTDLNNRAMPLIRYRLGDFGVPGEPCPCGRGLPVLAKIWGRAYDVVVAPDGRRYHGEFFMYLFEDLRAAGYGVQSFQVTQRSPTELHVAVVVPESDTQRVSMAILALLHERLPQMEVSVQRVDTIERTSSGKMQLIKNSWLLTMRQQA